MQGSFLKTLGLGIGVLDEPFLSGHTPLLVMEHDGVR
jgi:hypothetical protein